MPIFGADDDELRDGHREAIMVKQQVAPALLEVDGDLPELSRLAQLLKEQRERRRGLLR